LRNYRVAASGFEPDISTPMSERRESLRMHISDLLSQQSPDLLVLPEMVLVSDFDKLDGVGAEAIDGPTVALASKLASQHSCNICIPIVERCDGQLYNTAVYVDRVGKTIGKYRKHTPTQAELELGIRAGARTPDTVLVDGLRVGTAICMDENYPDIMWNYIAKGVDLLAFPSYTYGGAIIGNWALTCGVPLVCAFPWEAVIYDRDGGTLAIGGRRTCTVLFWHHPPWIARDLDMQSRVYHLDGNQTKLSDVMNKYGSQIDFQLMVREARVRITVASDDLDIDEVEKEFGLVGWQQYISETRAMADRTRQ
jgi:predicted amidohydrolase